MQGIQYIKGAVLIRRIMVHGISTSQLSLNIFNFLILPFPDKKPFPEETVPRQEKNWVYNTSLKYYI